MQTTIEELHVAVEELERSSQMLRSSNQELQLANLDLQGKLDAATRAHDDLGNLVASSGVATIFLDRDMRILRYTPRIADFFNVIPADIGRPLLHITNRLDRPQLAEEAARVFDTLTAMECEVRSKDGRDYIVRVHPYRTKEDRISGAVMTLFDITSRRAAETALRESEERLRLFLTASSDIIYEMNADWTVMRRVEGVAFLAHTTAPSDTWMENYVPLSDQPGVQAAIAQAIRAKTIFKLEHRVIRGDGCIGWTLSRAVPLLDASGAITGWFGAATDLGPRK
jgi:two-component system CheB/CheR fusion protein